MRVVFAGASEMAVHTAQLLIKDDHEVVIIEKDKAKIDELSEELDCSFVHGDVTRPSILKETNPEETDLLFCLTDDDPSNLITSLVGRSIGFKRVVTSIENTDFENICLELGLTDVIIPSQTISRYLKDLVQGVDILELSTLIKGEARFFSFVCGKEEQGKVSELKLPEAAKVICFYRDEEFYLASSDSKIEKDDEIVILTHSKNLPDLKEKWQPENHNENQRKKKGQ